MKFTILSVFFVFIQAATSNDCKEKLKNVLPMKSCCKMPELTDVDVKPIIIEQKKKYEKNDAMIYCMISYELFKKLNLLSLDRDECKKYVEKFSKGVWKEVMDSTIDTCVDLIPKETPEYQKALNLTTEQCDAKYTFFIDCIELTRFRKCPAETFTKSEKCENSIKFAEECEEDETIVQFLNME